MAKYYCPIFQISEDKGFQGVTEPLSHLLVTKILKPVRLSITLSAYIAKALQNSVKNTDESFQFLFNIFEVKTLQTFGSLKSNYKKHSF